MTLEQHKKRSNHIVQWINEHPLINVHMLAQLAGAPDSTNLGRAVNRNGRLVSKLYIDAVEEILKSYGFVPLKNQPEAK
jgi:hypothetical protein